ncbi:hypothetical protein FB446DRAFT_654975 [Lentinula raphanica]|nr:hypothetical protein FB446DRAFT_654975 [Lentinula raphanica]
MRHFLKPLVEDLSIGYTRGVRPYATHQTRHAATPYSRTFRTAIAPMVMDTKEAKPVGGFMDITSHTYCSKCKCWHIMHIGRTDCENWTPADDTFFRGGASKWRDSQKNRERSAIEYQFGTRWSALWLLPYWRPSRQIVVDPMHTFFLIVTGRYYRDILGLDNPDSKIQSKKPHHSICFHYPFTPPPPLSSALTQSMKPLSAYQIGDLHRILLRPVEDNDKNLQRSLNHVSAHALTFVCADLGRLPVGKYKKDDLVKSLISWRLSMPLHALEPLKIDSSRLLARVQQVIQEVITPAWLSKPPQDTGTARAGTLKADHWRKLVTVHVPLAMLSMWTEDSPVAAPDAHLMGAALETSMHLTCAAILMTKINLTAERRQLFQQHLIRHIEGIKQNFAGFIFPSHHLALHIYDFMEEFSGVRHFWAFPFEKLIGKRSFSVYIADYLSGEQQSTMHHRFCESAIFRQWLHHPDCPPLLQQCLKLLDKAYNYSTGKDEENQETLIADFINDLSSPLASPPKAPPKELVDLVGSAAIECMVRVPGNKGDYTIPGPIAIGNSYVCYNPQDGTADGRWAAGQIQHIYRERGRASISVAIRRADEVTASNAFSRFWEDGFKAKLVSIHFRKRLEIVPLSSVIAHTARWIMTEQLALVLNLDSVSTVISLGLLFA